nr:MAG: hypothetical protein [Gammatorquevirus sp.]
MQNLCAADFYKPTPYNTDTKNQIWMSQIADGHDNFCNCNSPFSHLLASIFPPGHTDRDKTITQILIRDYKEQCHSGGDAEKSSGMAGAGGDHCIKEEKEDSDANIDALLAAAAAAAEEDER